MSNLKNIAQTNLAKLLGQKRNTFSFPHLDKIVINYRCSASKDDSGELDNAKEEIMAITGQKPLLAKAKKSVASFKLKMGEPLAYKVTLRGQRMYDFAEKLFNIILPRLRDFQGLSDQAFDGQGNYNMVVKDQTYFPEINQDKVNKIRSVQATFVTSASSKKEAKMLLSALGFPFAK